MGVHTPLSPGIRTKTKKSYDALVGRSIVSNFVKIVMTMNITMTIFSSVVTFFDNDCHKKTTVFSGYNEIFFAFLDEL